MDTDRQREQGKEEEGGEGRRGRTKWVNENGVVKIYREINFKTKIKIKRLGVDQRSQCWDNSSKCAWGLGSDCRNASAEQQEMRGMSAVAEGRNGRQEEKEVREGTCRRGRTGTSIGLGRRMLWSFCAPFPAAFSYWPRAYEDATLTQFGPKELHHFFSSNPRWLSSGE